MNEARSLLRRFDELRVLSPGARCSGLFEARHEEKAGDPDGSEVIERAGKRDPDWPSMPPLGTEVVDAAGLSALRTWIRQL